MHKIVMELEKKKTKKIAIIRNFLRYTRGTQVKCLKHLTFYFHFYVATMRFKFEIIGGRNQ